MPDVQEPGRARREARGGGSFTVRHGGRVRARHAPIASESEASTGAVRTRMLVQVRVTLDIDADLLSRARELSGLCDRSELVRQGLELLIAEASARRLAELGGTEPDLGRSRRRRRRSE